MLDDGAIMPIRAHHADAGLDLYTPKDIYLCGGGSVGIDTGVHIEIPLGFYGDIRSKSGLLFKNDIITDGTIDSGYTGSIKVKLINLGRRSYHFEAGDKIAQMVIQRCELPELVVEDFATTTDHIADIGKKEPICGGAQNGVKIPVISMADVPKIVEAMENEKADS